MIPIEELGLTFEQAQKYAEDHLCTCGGRLSVAWGGSFGIQGYILRCGNDVSHTTMTRHTRKLSPDWAQAEKEFKERNHMDSTALTKMTEPQMLQRISMAKFPQGLTQSDEKMLAVVAIAYGFDPLMGEVSIYQGRPYVSIDGRYRKAQETGRLDGVRSRPATKQEKEDWGIPPDDYFFCAEVYVKGASQPFVGWGRVNGTETKGSPHLPVVKNPQRMAEKRAEAQALRKAFHIPLPSQEDIGSPETEDTKPQIIDGKTGEIIGAVSEDVAVTTESQKKPTGEGTGGIVSLASQKPVRDENNITSIPDLQKALTEDFNLALPDQLKELNLKFWSDFKTLKLSPAQAYWVVATPRQKKES